MTIEPFVMRNGSLYFMIVPESGVDEFLYSDPSVSDHVGFINSTLRNATKIGTYFNGGKIDVAKQRKLMDSFGIEPRMDKNLLGAFKIAILEGFVSFDFLFINSTGLSNITLQDLLVFLRELFQKNTNKAALIIQQNAVNIKSPYIFTEVNLEKVDPFMDWLETVEAMYRL